MDENLFLLLALGVVVVMLLLSNRRRKKAAEELKAKVVTGAYIMLTSGIYGKITKIDGERMELETAPGQKLTVALGAVRSIEEEPKKSTPAKAKTAKPKTSSKSEPKKK